MIMETKKASSALLRIADEVVSKETSGRSSHKTNLDYLFEILFVEEQMLSRTECKKQLAIRRIDSKYTDNEWNAMTEAEQIELFTSEFRTSSNAFDTAISKGHTNSCFSYNPKFHDYEIVKENNKFGIVKRAKSK